MGDTLDTNSRIYRLAKSLWKSEWTLLKIWKTQLLYNPVVSFLGIHPKEMKRYLLMMSENIYCFNTPSQLFAERFIYEKNGINVIELSKLLESCSRGVLQALGSWRNGISNLTFASIFFVVDFRLHLKNEAPPSSSGICKPFWNS